jgi:hypothetical protein
MQSDRHAAVIARDPRDSKALFAQSSQRVDFSSSRLERSSASWICRGGLRLFLLAVVVVGAQLLVPRRDVAQVRSINSLLQGEGAKNSLSAKRDFPTLPSPITPVQARQSDQVM